MSRRTIAVSRLLLALGVLSAARGVRGDDAFFLKGGERIVFFGDSITQAGQYVSYVETFLLTRFPGERFTIINHGVNSETISGASESDHFPHPRPHALPRYARDVAAWRPDVVVACFGMNDGNYHPFEEERFAKYQAGVRTLIARTRDETRARLVLLSPPPYDPYRRTVIDHDAREYGYRFPAVDYDRTLDRYSRWLLTLRDEGQTVVDVHGALAEHVRRRRESLVSFTISPDSIHPNPTGHWLMAQALLLEWHAPALCAEARIDAAALKADAGAVRDVRRDGPALVATWNTPLPMPIDPSWDPRSIALEKVSDRLNRYRLTITGLDAPRHRLLARLEDREEVDVGDFSREQLAQGLDLTTLATFPTVTLGHEVLGLVQQRRQAVYDRWRRRVASSNSGESPAAMSEDQGPGRKIRSLCRPRDVHLRLVPMGGHPPSQ
jgi:lysophospholipase L1-like esterase